MGDVPTISYLAGFFDGEGCIEITRERRGPHKTWSYILRISTSQNDPNPLYLLQRTFGGYVTQIGAYKKDRTDRTRAWRTTAKKAVYALEQMLPYMIVKKEQAIFAINWAQGPKSTRIKTVLDLEQLENDRLVLQKMKRVTYV